MRLVVYAETDILGGAEIVTGHLVEALRPDIEVVAMGPHPKVVEYLASRRDGARAIVVPPLRSRRELRAYPEHRRVLRSLAPAVFHAVLTFQTACQWPLIAASRVPGVLPIAVEHLPPLPDTWRGRAAKRRVVRVLDAHIAVGDLVARAVEAEFGLRPFSIETIHNGIPDVDVVPPAIPHDGFTVSLVAADLSPRKGVDVLIDALAAVDGTTLVVVGRGSDEGMLRARADSLGVADRIVWVGWSATPRGYVAATDALVLASRAEAFPLVILEAMLAERAVIATDVGSVSELVVDAKTGILVPPDDPAALAVALRTLAADPRRRTEMGIAGRQRALSSFSLDAMTRSYEQLYDRITLEHSI